MRFLWSMAWRNLWRQRRRSLIAASAMAVAVALCMATIAITDWTYGEMVRMAVEQRLGHVQVHHPDYPVEGLIYDALEGREALLVRIDALEGTVAAGPRVEGFALLGGETISAGAQLIGVPPARDRQVSSMKDRVTEGAWLSDAPGHEIVLGYKLAREIEARIGDTVVALTQAIDGSVGNDLYRVVGLFKSGDVGRDQGAAYLHIADGEALLGLADEAHAITILTDDLDEVGDYAERLREAIGSDEVEVQTWWEASPATADMLQMRDGATSNLIFLIFLVSAFGVVNTMLMAVFERTHELGLLRALGLRPGKLVWLVVLESAFLGAIACGVGLILGGLLDWYLVVYGIDLSATMPEGMSYQGVQLDPVMRGEVRPESVVSILIAVFFISVLASLWPAWRAARLDPVDAMREE